MPRLVRILARMRAREVGDDYTYYGIASPWLQVRHFSGFRVLRCPVCRPAGRSPPPPLAGMGNVAVPHSDPWYTLHNKRAKGD